MSQANLQSEFRDVLRERVGGFLHNTHRVAGVTCAVCSVPTDGDLCSPCREQRAAFGSRLADQVFTLTYVRGHATHYHQSAYLMRAYKQQSQVGGKGADDLALLVRAATYIHGDCLQKSVGSPWSALTFVPSARMPGAAHPVADLARRVVGVSVEKRFQLSLGPSSGLSRTVRADQFVVPPQFRARLEGQHALIVDDTWVSGGKAQSAALAVRDAGAQTVTVLCVARWCRYDWPDHRAFLDGCTAPYDAYVCPAAYQGCPVL